MKKSPFANFALLLVATALPVYYQGMGIGQSASDCSSPLLASTVGCERNSQQLSNSQSGVVSSKTLGSSPAEIAPLVTGNTFQPESALPPQMPTEFQKFVAASVGQMLPIFGEDLFQHVPSTFAPDNLAPPTPGYVIGPNDELRIRIWGQVDYSGNLRVDRSGAIYLPDVGPVQVAGLQFSALDRRLREAVAKLYRNFDLSVDLGPIRSMQVYVTGQARRPGVYTISSLSTLVDALFASGGPSGQGSLRHILVNREGKTIADFDLYALLIHGDKSKDLRLMPGDVLYIPPAGLQVAITGSIHNPAIYEMHDGETVGNLLEVAGKTTTLSSRARISIDRVGPDKVRQAVELPFDASGLATPLADGDIVRILAILPAYEKTITLRGNVADPGRFSWRPGMHLSDVIPDRDSLESRDYWWKRSHLGLPSPEFEPVVSPQAETLAPGLAGNVQGAAVTTRAASGNSVQGAGNGTLGSQIAQTPVPGGTGGGKLNDVRITAPEINWDYAVIERLDPESLRTSLIPFDLGKLVLNHDASQDFALQPGDTVTIFSQADIIAPLDRQTKYVDLEGEFLHSGIYSVQPGETLRDVVRRAGGLTPRAYLYGAEFTRESTRRLQQQRLDDYLRTLSAEVQQGTQQLAVSGSGLSGASNANASQIAGQQLIARLSAVRATGRIVLQFQPNSGSIEEVPPLSLENGDRFVVPFAPAVVNVVGAVYDQNSFLYEPRRTVAQYLRLAGGPTRNADWHRAYVIHADGSVVSRTDEKGYSLWTGGSPFSSLRLNPGDSIVVPNKLLRPTVVRDLMDWTQVFSQLALGAAVVNLL